MAFWTKNEGSSSTPASQEKKAAEINETKPAVLGGAPSMVDAKPETKTAATPTSGNLEDQLATRFGKLRSALGAGTVIQGKLSFDTPVRIDGKLSGEVFSSDALIVGASGRIDANIEAAYLIVLGVVTGSVKASKKVELYAGGRIESDISTPSFVMEEGSVFQGKCAMGYSDKIVTVDATSKDLKAPRVMPPSKDAPPAPQPHKTEERKENTEQKPAASTEARLH